MSRLRAFGASDPGQERRRNEDALHWQLDRDAGRLVAVVADGVGGAPAGDQASQLACRALCRELQGAPRRDSPQRLAGAVQAAHQALRQEQRDHPELRGMASTVVALLLRPGEGWVAHAGDSRAYRWRDGTLQRLTRDHTLAQAMVDNGTLTPERAEFVPYSQVLSRALGVGEAVDSEVQTLDPLPGDRYLLCSDGLFRSVHEAHIAARVAEDGAPQQRVAELLAAANDAGGPDNITVFLVDILED